MKLTNVLETCAHETCLCAPRLIGKFCCDYCEDAFERGDIQRCECGHDGCGAEPLIDENMGLAPQMG